MTDQSPRNRASGPFSHVPILIARRVTDAVARRARREFDALLCAEDMDAGSVIESARRQTSVAVVIGPSARLGEAEIAALPVSVRIIANSTVGYDHMDVAAARTRGIIVTNTPDVLTECTADLALFLMLAACRRAAEYSAIMRAGWRRTYGMHDMLGRRLSGRTLGIIGMGRIGQAVARRAYGFGMTVHYHNRHRLAPAREDGATYHESLAAMLPRCQVLSLHLPGGEQSGVVMTREAFGLLPDGAVFVNTARGSLVDEEALLDSLSSGRLYGAGLDVFRNEPNIDRRFLALPNVFLTPHMGSATTETRDAMGFRALDNVAAVLGGGPPIDAV